jgi:hypothetical protein
MVKTKALWREIVIPGMRDAFVAIVDGQEVGSICRPTRTAAWQVYRGSGLLAEHRGNSYNKEGAKWLLLGK